ncbi:MAG: ABC transporter permease [Ruminococcaceae bacterium]|nr:ABC transporter permease [Oscillospiraceae bacterium]
MIITNLKWFLAFFKRMSRKPVFLVTLLIIPVICIAMNVVSDEESGIMIIGLSSYDVNDSVYKNIARELKSESTSLLFVEYSTPDEAIEDVKKGKASSAWVFADDLDKTMAEFVSGNTEEKLCNVYLNEDTVLKQLSREKLHGVLFKNLSYDIYVNFMNSRNIDSEYADENTYKELFDAQKESLSDELIAFEFYNSPNKKIEDTNYLTSPLRGLLATALIICCLAAMMYSLEDENEGKYAMFPINKRLKLHYLSSYASVLYVFVAVIIAMSFSGLLRENIFLEIIYLLVYCIISVGFCVAVGIVCKKKARLCFAFPMLIVLTIALCPIFVSVPGLEPIKVMLPTYHYLMTFVDPLHFSHMLLYAVIIYGLDFVLYRLLNRE